ncbi:MAG: hypothetical protein LC105_04600 [Chitinophagales bacterium]|nr:hypothetical protein [Chitinophagales bacterium]MCZ2393122.1 hypothetical protein [Chitinophagales bacterium]
MNYNRMKSFFLVFAMLLLLACNSENKEIIKDNANLSIPQDISHVIAIGRIAPLHGIVYLAVEESGIVQSVGKEEGDSVRKGDVIIELNAAGAFLNRQQIDNQINTQLEQIKVDELSIQQLLIQLNSKEKSIKTIELLSDKGADTKENLDAAYTDRDILIAQIAQSRKKIDVAQSKLKELSSQRAIAENELGKSVVKSPSNGVLLSQDAKVGAAFRAFETFASFAPEGPWVVESEVDEMFANRLHIGQKVSIRYMGHDKVISTGTISSLSPNLSNKSLFSDEPAEMQDRRVRRFKVLLDSTDYLLLNSKVECNIQIQ